jgi:hypothetical protein
MIKENFSPILSELIAHEDMVRQEIETEVKKDFGVYDLYIEKAKLKLQLEEISNRLSAFESKYAQDGDYTSKITHEVNRRMKKLRSPFRQEVEAIQNDLIYKIKLSGINIDIRGVFANMPEIIRELQGKLQLECQNAKPVIQIANNKKPKTGDKK